MRIQGVEDELDHEDEASADDESAVALIGMSGRFPGASTVARLWENLTRGELGLRAVGDEEAIAAGLDPAVAADPGYVPVGGPVGGIELFDAAVFGLTEREAEIMEPQHRLLLECAWEALESAGYRPTEPDGVVGIYAGCSFPDYMLRNLRLAKDPEGARSFAAGNERDSLTSLVSYKLGLRGPGVTVQSFCSTSLVAVHLACQSLLTYETDIALAGGASLPLPQPAGYVHRPDGIYSPDGRIRPFDAAANGTVPGSGVGVVALKRLADALADGDVIHAVIRGSAVNNDGRDRAGYSAPGVDGEAEVIEAALAVAGVKPESVGYLECHAVGTPLGDSIELAALGRVFGDAAGTRVLGSVKPAVGHLDAASGVTALIRAALCLRHALLPAVPGFQTPNPALAAAEGRFTVLQQDQPWPAGPEPRRAGVSSFGVGGTNAHLVLEEAPAREPRATHAEGPQLLTFSAADEQALNELTGRLRDHLVRVSEGREESQSLADIAYTLQVSRGRFALRRAVVCQHIADAIDALGDPTRWINGLTQRRDPQIRPVAAEDLPGLARMWLAGSQIDWKALHQGAGRRVELPTYPFQRRRHWIDAQTVPLPQPVTSLDHDLELEPDARLRAEGPWLLLGSDAAMSSLEHKLLVAGAEVISTDGSLEATLRELIVAPRKCVIQTESVTLTATLSWEESTMAASDHTAQADTAPAGRAARPTLAAPYIEPESGLERAIADAWMDALNVEPIGADDNFFELGGRSLTAVQLAASIGAAQAVTLPATAVVEHSTVRALASRIRDAE